MARTILAAVDLTEPDMTAKVFSAAVEQAQIPDSTLVIFNVVPDIVSGLDYRYAIRGERGGSADFDMKQLVSDCLERLNQVAAEHLPDGMKVQTIVRHGIVYEQVLNLAKEISADQIIIGARRTSSVGDFLIGSNSARVVRHATCSVNVIRE